jgi:hypothetical protein
MSGYLIVILEARQVATSKIVEMQFWFRASRRAEEVCALVVWKGTWISITRNIQIFFVKHKNYSPRIFNR